MKYVVKILVFAWAVMSCNRDANPQPERVRLKSYRIIYETEKEREVYRGVYSYDKSGRLLTEIQNDTTYLKTQGLIQPVQTTFENFYDENGFLTKRVRSAVSIQLTNTTTTTYEYREGRLSLENFGNRVTEYRYNADGTLKTTISTSLTNGSKTVVDYLDDIPKLLERAGNGYIFKATDEITLLSSNLLITRYEKYTNGNLVFEQDYDQQKEGVPQSFLPDYQGFPKIKNAAYRRGVERSIVTYQTINGNRLLTDEKRLNPEFDEAGRLIRSTGYEKINQETSKPESRNLTFEYEYEFW